MGEPKSYKKKGTVKKILKDHFHGFWQMHAESYPESVRKSIEETVQKAMKCGSRDLGFALYECKGCKEGEPEPV
ncbi:transposase zinc-binding domain-containing protein, partial [Paenibacillus alginolyticus]